MFADLNRRLEEIKELKRKQHKLQGQLERARQSLEKERLRRSELAAKLSKEDQDVQRLEKMGLAARYSWRSFSSCSSLLPSTE